MSIRIFSTLALLLASTLYSATEVHALPCLEDGKVTNATIVWIQVYAQTNHRHHGNLLLEKEDATFAMLYLQKPGNVMGGEGITGDQASLFLELATRCEGKFSAYNLSPITFLSNEIQSLYLVTENSTFSVRNN